jgi:chemotaxis protein MotC
VIRATLLAIFLIWAAPVSPALAAATRDKAPFEIVRALRIFQDEAVLKAKVDSATQREAFVEAAARLSKFAPGVWEEPKNARAIVIFVLSGGDPRVLRNLIAKGISFGVDKQLVLAALAYAERRDDDAIKLLESLDANSLDMSVGGHVALVHALLIEKKDPPRALALLDMARILSSGTVVEEAALRRQTIMAANAGRFDAFERFSSQYFRRFAISIFASSFRQQFAEEVVAPGYAGDPKRLARLDGMLGGLRDVERHRTCLLIAEAGIAVGNIEMVRLAARRAALKSVSPDALRLKLYEASASVVTKRSEEGLVALRSINRSMLGGRDQVLLDAALAVAREIRRPPAMPAKGADVKPKANAGEPEQGEPTEAAGSARIAHAQEVIAGVDKLLSEAAR